jgi:hypothetical protein
MSHSKIERFNQRILKDVILRLYKLLLVDNEENPKIYNISDDGVFSSIENILDIMGFGTSEYEDIDFVFALYIKNYHLIKDGKIEGDIEIPSLGTYTFTIDVTERVIQTTTYKHRVTSYSKLNVIPISHRAENDGNFSVWEGQDIDTEYNDSDTIDIEWNNDVEKLK